MILANICFLFPQVTVAAWAEILVKVSVHNRKEDNREPTIWVLELWHRLGDAPIRLSHPNFPSCRCEPSPQLHGASVALFPNCISLVSRGHFSFLRGWFWVFYGINARIYIPCLVSKRRVYFAFALYIFEPNITCTMYSVHLIILPLVYHLIRQVK
jgi:hypothetical protein